MLPRFAKTLILTALAAVSLSHAGGHPGLVVKTIWVQNGKVIVRFDDATSNPSSVASVRAAYTENFADYKNVLAVLMQAKATATTVKVYTGAGGTTLPSLIDSSEPNYWASTISMVALE